VKNQNLKEVYWQKVNFYLRFLKWIPFLRAAFVCNNLAFGKVDQKSDIDLFIIAKKNRLFFVRTFVTLTFSILRIRRHGKKTAGRFCLSFFVDDSALNFEKIAIEKDYYLAYWITNLVPVIDDGISKSFLSENNWIKNYFPKNKKFEYDYTLLIDSTSKVRELFKFIFKGKLGSLIENLLMKWQLKRATKKMKEVSKPNGLVVNEHMLKFHNLDRRKYFREKWLKNYGLTKLNQKKFNALIDWV
jgi:hypothetical protein